MHYFIKGTVITVSINGKNNCNLYFIGHRILQVIFQTIFQNKVTFVIIIKKKNWLLFQKLCIKFASLLSVFVCLGSFLWGGVWLVWFYSGDFPMYSQICSRNQSLKYYILYLHQLLSRTAVSGLCCCFPLKVRYFQGKRIILYRHHLLLLNTNFAYVSYFITMSVPDTVEFYRILNF